MGRGGKLAIVIIQMIIAIIFLLGAIVGLILGAINAGGFSEMSFSGDIGGIVEGAASSAVYGLVLFFSVVLFLLSLFILLDALYKWPPAHKKIIVRKTRIVK